MKPTHYLKIMDKINGHKVNAGVGFLNDDESISICINPAIVIQHNNDFVITLFPVNEKRRI